jgi:prepilin-type processing-associated H-X9-DG protein
MFKSPKSKGFTRGELIVVIIVTVVLTAILFPAMPPIDTTRARQSVCTFNEKQLGLAFIQYTQDYDGKFPCGNLGSGRGWAGEIYPYDKNTILYTCPNDIKPDNDYRPISYAFNINLSGKHQMALKDLTDPSKTVELCEISHDASTNAAIINGSENDSIVTDGYWRQNFMDRDAHYPADGSARLATGDMTKPLVVYTDTYHRAILDPDAHEPRHGSGSIFLAADGHVKYLTARKVSPGLTAGSAQSRPDQSTKAAAGTGTDIFALTFSVR